MNVLETSSRGSATLPLLSPLLLATVCALPPGLCDCVPPTQHGRQLVPSIVRNTVGEISGSRSGKIYRQIAFNLRPI